MNKTTKHEPTSKTYQKETKLQTAVKQYITQGFKVVPVHLSLDSEGKKVVKALPWKHDEVYLPKDFTKWHNAIAVKTGRVSDVFVIDEDKIGALKKHGITDEHLSIFPSVKTQNPEHGPHYWSAFPKELAEKIDLTRAGIKEGIDTRGEGGLVFAPPSVVVGGGGYEWKTPIPETGLPNLTKELEDLLIKLFPPIPKLTELPKGEVKEPSPKQWQYWNEEVEKYLEKYQTTEDRSGLDYHLTCEARKLCIPEAELIETLHKPANAKCRGRGQGQNYIERLQVIYRSKEIGQSPKYLRDQKEKLNQLVLSFDMSDDGNAERLVALFGHKLTYCHEQRKWFIWNGSYWKEDNMLEIQHLMRYVIKQIGKAASDLDDDNKKDKWWKFCIASRTAHRTMGAISLARSDPAVAHVTSDFDKNHYLLNVKNGTIDLRTGTIRPFKQSDFITKMANVTYDPKAKCPLWNSFLERIMDKNQDLISFLHKAAGYSFTADVRERIIFILYGGGNNGKSTFLAVLRGILGDYACDTPATTLYATQHEQHPTSIARLREKRLVIATETEENKKLAEGLIKQFTTGEGKENIVAHLMRQDDIEFPPLMKVWFGTNHKPRIRGTDTAIWSRIRLIPFSVTIPFEERIGDLSRKLEPEFPGILNQILQGCVKWWNDKRLDQPEEVRQATSAYRFDEDITQRFVKETMVADRKTFIESKKLYEHYKQWCQETGEWPPMTQNRLGRRLEELGYKRDNPGGVSIRHGLRIRIFAAVEKTGKDDEPYESPGTKALNKLKEIEERD